MNDLADIDPATPGFGQGTLVSLEARVALEELLGRFLGFELSGPVDWLASSLVRGRERVPLSL